MDASDFGAGAPGKLVPTIGGAQAFVPSPPPASIDLDLPTVKRLARAENALGHLNGTIGRLLNPNLIASPLLYREAILSSRIEGIVTTPEELVLFEVGHAAAGGTSRLEDTREVRNYILAMRHGYRRLKELPVSVRLIREIHEVLLKDARISGERPGEFRTVQNCIGQRSADAIAGARFVPPPVKEMLECLPDLDDYARPDAGRGHELPLLIRVALIHYQFEAIHPFRNGNGRVGRLLVPLLLCSHARLTEPLLYLSAYFDRRRLEYFDLLLRVSQVGDWTSWGRFFLDAVLECSVEARRQAEGLLELRRRYHEACQSARSSTLLLKLVDQLFHRPSITIAEAASVLEIAPAAASANLQKLADAGVIVEWTGRQRDQAFIATEIVAFMRDSPEGTRDEPAG